MVLPPIRVLVVDDHPIAREGSRGYLEQDPGIVVVGATESGADAIEMAQTLRPDVVVLDLRLPDISGLEVARQLRVLVPEVKILVLTGYDSLAYRRFLKGIGVPGYLDKSAGGNELVAAVHTLNGGLPYSSPLAGEDEKAEKVVLSAREQEILHLIASGWRNSEIGKFLGLTENTVEYYVRSMLSKLNARSRTEAVARARQHGLIPDDRSITPPGTEP